MINQLIFVYLAIAMITLSVVIITRKNVVHSIIYMLVLFFHIASMYLFLNAEFLAAIQIIVYAGAIMVLFLFVIMLLNLRDEFRKHRYSAVWPLSIVITSLLTIFIYISIVGYKFAHVGKYGIEEVNKLGHSVVIGKVLFIEYLFPFEIASLLLLVAIVGAIVVAKKEIK